MWYRLAARDSSETGKFFRSEHPSSPIRNTPPRSDRSTPTARALPRSESTRTRRRTPAAALCTLVESRRRGAARATPPPRPATDHASPLARAIALDDDDDDDDEHARDADVDPRAGRASIARARARKMSPRTLTLEMPTRTPSPRSRASPPWKRLERHQTSSDARSSSVSRARPFARRFLTSSARLTFLQLFEIHLPRRARRASRVAVRETSYERARISRRSRPVLARGERVDRSVGRASREGSARDARRPERPRARSTPRARDETRRDERRERRRSRAFSSEARTKSFTAPR